MNHEFVEEGPAFRLRPVEVSDAAFIVGLRRDPDRSRFIHETSPVVADQERWIERYLDRAGDYYFIIEGRRSGKPEGTVGVYDADETERRSAEWGRWVLSVGSAGAVESVYLTYRFAFSRLGLASVYCRTVPDNTQVVSFHESCGLETRQAPGIRVRLVDGEHEVVEQFLTREAWDRRRSVLQDRVTRLARMLGAT